MFSESSVKYEIGWSTSFVCQICWSALKQERHMGVTQLWHLRSSRFRLSSYIAPLTLLSYSYIALILNFPKSLKDKAAFHRKNKANSTLHRLASHRDAPWVPESEYNFVNLTTHHTGCFWALSSNFKCWRKSCLTSEKLFWIENCVEEQTLFVASHFTFCCKLIWGGTFLCNLMT